MALARSRSSRRVGIRVGFPRTLTGKPTPPAKSPSRALASKGGSLRVPDPARKTASGPNATKRAKGSASKPGAGAGAYGAKASRAQVIAEKRNIAKRARAKGFSPDRADVDATFRRNAAKLAAKAAAKTPKKAVAAKGGKKATAAKGGKKGSAAKKGGGKAGLSAYERAAAARLGRRPSDIAGGPSTSGPRTPSPARRAAAAKAKAKAKAPTPRRTTKRDKYKRDSDGRFI